jgi:hypothetical protein
VCMQELGLHTAAEALQQTAEAARPRAAPQPRKRRQKFEIEVGSTLQGQHCRLVLLSALAGPRMPYQQLAPCLCSLAKERCCASAGPPPG